MKGAYRPAVFIIWPNGAPFLNYDQQITKLIIKIRIMENDFLLPDFTIDCVQIEDLLSYGEQESVDWVSKPSAKEILSHLANELLPGITILSHNSPLRALHDGLSHCQNNTPDHLACYVLQAIMLSPINREDLPLPTQAIKHISQVVEWLKILAIAQNTDLVALMQYYLRVHQVRASDLRLFARRVAGEHSDVAQILTAIQTCDSPTIQPRWALEAVSLTEEYLVYQPYAAECPHRSGLSSLIAQAYRSSSQAMRSPVTSSVSTALPSLNQQIAVTGLPPRLTNPKYLPSLEY